MKERVEDRKRKGVSKLKKQDTEKEKKVEKEKSGQG